MTFFRFFILFSIFLGSVSFEARASFDFRCFFQNVTRTLEEPRSEDPSKIRLLLEQYQNKIFFPESEQVRFQALAQKEGRNYFFFHVQFAILKEANDQIFGDKNLVTALENLYQTIFFDLLTDDAYLMSKLEGRSSDFKSMNFAFKKGSNSNDFEKTSFSLSLLHKQAAILFEEQVRALGFHHRLRGRGAGIENPQHWHVAGFSDRFDEAVVSSRLLRVSERPYDELARLMIFRDQEKELWQQYLWFRNANAKLKNLQQNSGVDFGNLQFLERLRKEKDLDFSSIQKIVSEEFQVDLSLEDAKLLQWTYLRQKEVFSVEPYTGKRMAVHSVETPHGFVSIDLAGQGSRNLRDVFQELDQGNFQNSRELVAALRRAEHKSTIEFQNAIQSLEDLVKKHLGDSAQIQCSGDDCMVVFLENISDSKLRTFLSSLQEHESKERFRVVYSSQLIKMGERSRLIVLAEDFEKKMRAWIRKKDSSYLGAIHFEFEVKENGMVIYRIQSSKKLPYSQIEIKSFFEKYLLEKKEDPKKFKILF